MHFEEVTPKVADETGPGPATRRDWMHCKSSAISLCDVSCAYDDMSCLQVPKVPKLPTLKLDAVDINADDIDAPEESKSPRIKHSARSLGGKLKDAMSKGLTPRRSRLLAVLTPRSRNNLDSVVRASASESSKAPALQQGPLNAGAGSQQKASHDAISGMSAAQLEGELRLARTDLMATKKVRLSAPRLHNPTLLNMNALCTAPRTSISTLEKAAPAAVIATERLLSYVCLESANQFQ